MAPSWISTSNVLPELQMPRKCSVNRRCPVEDTGRNSVTPSMSPSRMTCQIGMDGTSRRDGICAEASADGED